MGMGIIKTIKIMVRLQNRQRRSVSWVTRVVVIPRLTGVVNLCVANVQKHATACVRGAPKGVVVTSV